MKRRILAAVAVVLAACAPLYAAPPSLDTRVPKDALLYVQWAGADSQKAAYEGSNLQGLVNATGIPAYLQQNIPQWLNMASEGDPNAAAAFTELQKDLAVVWQHPTSVYVSFDPIAGPEPMPKIAILCDAGDDAAPLVASLDDLLKKNPPDPDAHLQVTNDKGLVIITLGKAQPADFAAGIPSLAADPVYQKTFKSLQAAPAVKIYVDVHGSLERVNQAVAAMAPANVKAMVPAIIDTLGLNSVTQFGYTGGFNGKNWDELAFLGINGPHKGLLKSLDNPPLTNTELGMIPKDAVAFTVTRIDWGNLYSLARQTITVIDKANAAPAGETLAESMDDGLKYIHDLVGVDVEKDVVNALGSDVAIYRFNPEGGALASVFVQKLKDPAAFTRAIDAAEGFLNERLGARMRISKIDAGDNIEVSAIRLPQGAVAWVVRGDYFYISSDAAIGAAIVQIEKKQPSVVDNPDYQAARAALGDHLPSTLSFSNPAKVYPELYNALQTLLILAATQGIDIPNDLLPSPEAATPFLTPGASMSWVDAEGVHFTSHMAFPGASLFAANQAAPGARPAKSFNPKPAEQAAPVSGRDLTH